MQMQGSDGRKYNFLCKHERCGDLRKDMRVMEFVSVVNRLLQRDPEGQRRKLRLRTYAVICLNESCGLMEWVENTTGLRSCIRKAFQSCGLSHPVSCTNHVANDMNQVQDLLRLAVGKSARSAMPNSGVKIKGYPPLPKYLDKKKYPNGSIEHQQKGMHLYRTKVLPKFPPVFHRWFTDQFPIPTEWFEARLNFARTLATWSIVGHCIGLGDRHSENILMDLQNGGIVMVDFDCIFDKGLTFRVSERVPFRLTRNLVDALGVTGYEGVFRRVAEVTLTVLRRERETLMSVLETFIRDPLVDWENQASRRYKRDLKVSMEINQS